MNRSAAISLILLVGVGTDNGILFDRVDAASFSPMNMMNPSRWFGRGNRDDDYYGPGYGEVPYGAPGYWAPGYGHPPAYGGYGAPLAPGGYHPVYQTPPPVPAQTAPAEDPSAARIKELEERIRQLESSQSTQPSYPQSTQPYAPAGQAWSPQGSEPYPPAEPSWSPQGSEPYPPAEPSWSPQGSDPSTSAEPSWSPQGPDPYPSGQDWSPQGTDPYPPAGQPYLLQKESAGAGGVQPSSPYQSYGPD